MARILLFLAIAKKAQYTSQKGALPQAEPFCPYDVVVLLKAFGGGLQKPFFCLAKALKIEMRVS